MSNEDIQIDLDKFVTNDEEQVEDDCDSDSFYIDEKTIMAVNQTRPTSAKGKKPINTSYIDEFDEDLRCSNTPEGLEKAEFPEFHQTDLEVNQLIQNIEYKNHGATLGSITTRTPEKRFGNSNHEIPL